MPDNDKFIVGISSALGQFALAENHNILRAFSMILTTVLSLVILLYMMPRHGLNALYLGETVMFSLGSMIYTAFFKGDRPIRRKDMR